MTRTDRLLSIVLALQARRWQRAEDLAAMLDVSMRTIYRDMQALMEGGVPVVAVPGKGYRLNESYLLPPLMLTIDEAVLLLPGSDYVAQHFDDRYRAAARTAAQKIRAVLPEEAQDRATALQESLRFIPVNVFDNPAEQARLQQLRRALVEPCTVRFRYRPRADRNGRADEHGPDDERHTVDPYGLVERGGAWYLVGFDHRHGDVRHVPLTRMDELVLLDATFERPASYRRPPTAAAEQRDVTVRVHFDAHAARWVSTSPSSYVADMEEVADGLLVTLKVHREAELLPWLLGWGAHARVLEPASLRYRLAEEAARIAAHYQPDQLLLA